MQPESVAPMLLLIEDNDIDAELVRRLCRRHFSDLPIVRARNGVEALEVLQREGENGLSQPFVMLLDLNMPLMNGFELLDHLNLHGPEIDMPIYVLTTSNSQTDLKLSDTYSVDGYLVKPLTKAALADVLSAVSN